MRRACALLLLLCALHVGCGKYGPPRRVRPEPPAPAASTAPAEPETGAEPGSGAEIPEPAEAQEKDQ